MPIAADKIPTVPKLTETFAKSVRHPTEGTAKSLASRGRDGRQGGRNRCRQRLPGEANGCVGARWPKKGEAIRAELDCA